MSGEIEDVAKLKVRQRRGGSRSSREVVAEQLRPSFYTAFSLYYTTFVGYGLTAGILGAYNIQHAAPDLFGVIWGYLIAFFGMTAAVGVVLSHRFREPWVEVASACLLIGLMVGYAIAIVDRGYQLHDVTRVAGAWLPILASVFPVMRLLWLSDDLLRKKGADDKERAR